jgi:hypoxanthine phosphoribosyltransferase
MASRRPRPLVSERRLRARVRELGRRIAADYRGRELHLVGVLHGAFVFMADLARAIPLPLTCDFLRVSSYRSGTETSGSLRFELELARPVRGRHVLVVEDIVDTGLTATAVLAALRRRKPDSLRLCSLLHKPSRERAAVRIDYLGFTVPDRFVVGYGLDFDSRWRNLPYLGTLSDR